MAKTKKTTEAATVAAVPAGYVPTLKKLYRDEIVQKLMKEFSYTTVMQVPRLVKITINQGVGDATGDKKLVENAQQELTAIAGQKAVATLSRKDISNFKLRKGNAIGVKVTLRGTRMYEFLERLRCTNSSRGLSVSPFRVSGTSTVFPRRWTAEETIPSVSRSRLSSLRSTSTRFPRSSEWKSHS